VATLDHVWMNARALPWEQVVLYLIVINAFTFMVYRQDKNASIRGEWRIAESTLHVLSFIGGVVGAFVAQRMLRHKTKKLSFQITFWLLVGVQLFLLAFLSFR
jgi:uncharacterized membrane protein YsdA (DUF1294 family)